jgi:regulator of RNase E activity RraA
VKELIELGVPTLHEAAGRAGLMNRGALLVGGAFAGPARTVSIPSGDNLGVHLAPLRDPAPGHVLCVASGGQGAFGVIGELMVEQIRMAGWRRSPSLD